MWLRRLDERLLTGEDLSQLLRGILAALVELWDVDGGGIVALDDGKPSLDLWTGDLTVKERLLGALEGAALRDLVAQDGFQSLGDFLGRALRDEDGQLSGILVIDRPDDSDDPVRTSDTQQLVSGIERALADRAAQERVLGALRALEPELARMQRVLARTRQEAPSDLAADLVSPDPQASDELVAWVREALAHYWGGPKLSDSPLLRLPLVREALGRHEGNTAKAVRAVLDQALERLRPDGERSLTASQWLLYNILELKFVRGLKVRDIAGRLAMSESDLYRKQRVAIEALAQELAALSRQKADPVSGPEQGAGSQAREAQSLLDPDGR